MEEQPEQHECGKWPVKEIGTRSIGLGFYFACIDSVQL